MGKILKLYYKDGSTQFIKLNDVKYSETVDDIPEITSTQSSSYSAALSTDLVYSTLCPRYVSVKLQDYARIETIGDLLHHTEYQVMYMLKPPFRKEAIELIETLKKKNLSFEPAIDYRSMPIEEIDFIKNSNAMCFLLKAGIARVSDITAKTPNRLRDVKGIGKETYSKIYNWLKEHGLTLASEGI